VFSFRGFARKLTNPLLEMNILPSIPQSSENSNQYGRIISRDTASGDISNERLRLENANYDLKLKLHHLESNTKRGASRIMDGIEIFPSSDKQSAVFLQQLDEKSIELEQRNLLLVRAKYAIEALKTELESSQQQAHYSDEKLIRALSDNADISSRYNESVANFQSRMDVAENLIASKENLRSQAEDKLVSNCTI
jgi:hypothetical protein